MTNKDFPCVVVLDLTFSGYSVLRSLSKYNIPVIGYYSHKHSPEQYTKLCTKKIRFANFEQLLESLIDISKNLDKKPVLILTADVYVQFYIKHRDKLDSRFLVNMPDSKTVDLLLDKNKFADFADDNNILIPKSIKLLKEGDIESCNEKLRFPVILKPYLRTQQWNNAGFPKVYILNGINELQITYNSVSKVENNLIVQEYIQGDDDHLEYCLVYFSAKSECLMAFTGKKIRQWPVGTGTVSTTTSVKNEWLEQETIRIFKTLKYTGFGSIEYKRDAVDGKYYIMEPTVGRLDSQEYIATLCGFNIPLVGYKDLSGLNIKNLDIISDNIIYIDGLAEVCSTFAHFKRKLISFSKWRKSLMGKRVYRFWNKKDKKVFIGLSIHVIILVFNKINLFKTKKNE